MIETRIVIDGMQCGMCEAHINDTLRARFEVRRVSSSHRKGETVVLSDRPLDECALREAITETGYTVLSVQTGQAEEKKGLFGFLKR